MDWEQIILLRDAIQEAIAEGIRDGFANQEKPPPPIDLRDFFAGCALADTAKEYTAAFSAEEIAIRAYELADTMLLAKIGKADA